MEYQPKTSWLKGKLYRDKPYKPYNIAEAKAEAGQIKHLQNYPNSRLAKQIVGNISKDVTAYIRHKNKERGTESSAQRKTIK
jgi:hypothetical protein